MVFAMQFCAFSQTVEVEKSARIEKFDGKEFYIHTVIKGQTLYSISKAYNVLISEIIFDNPAVIDGIKPDMELKILVNSMAKDLNNTTQEEPVEINGKYRIHKVDKGQTLYSISKQYNVNPEQLRQVNPDMSDTLRLGQRINIPVEQLIRPDETVYTSAFLNNISDTTAFVLDTNSIDVVLLLPLYLKENDKVNIDTISGNIRETIYAKSLNALEFYEGAQMAVDSISRTGMKATVYLFDSPDEENLNKLLSNPILKQADLIIGPFYGKKFEAIADFASKNKIACVTPVLRRDNILENNPFISKVMPSDERLIRQMGDFVGRWNCKKNLIVMHNGSTEDSLRLSQLMKGINGRCDSAKLNVLNTKGKSVKFVDSVLVKGVENIVVCLSDDQNYVSRLILHLEKKNTPEKERVVTLFGLSEWQDYESIEVEYFQNVNLHIPVDLFVDYNSDAVKKFLVSFREKYLAEPGKYSLLGYDVTLYYLQMLKKYGNGFFLNPPAIHSSGLQSNFDFIKVSEQGGLENQCTFILNYKEYSLVKVN